MKISIIGLGFVGNSILESFKLKNINICGTFDKYKNGGIGSFESCLDADIIFSALPTIYCDEKKEYDKEPLHETLKLLKENNFKGIFVIKSTIEPGTTKELSKLYGIKLVHNPEFLTARTAFEDFHHQKHIVLGYVEEKESIIKEFYETYYPDAKISLCSSDESESMKIFCNSFYAVKIQFFNEIYVMCQKMGMDYEKVKEMMISNEWINPMHTNVPGPDNKLSYGGLCFPKDTNALNNFLKRNNLPRKVLNATIEERNLMRDDHDNCSYGKVLEH